MGAQAQEGHHLGRPIAAAQPPLQQQLLSLSQTLLPSEVGALISQLLCSRGLGAAVAAALEAYAASQDTLALALALVAQLAMGLVLLLQGPASMRHSGANGRERRRSSLNFRRNRDSVEELPSVTERLCPDAGDSSAPAKAGAAQRLAACPRGVSRKACKEVRMLGGGACVAMQRDLWRRLCPPAAAAVALRRRLAPPRTCRSAFALLRSWCSAWRP
mmetsp:Transcript_15058/g.57149  ORF Transcript_15058/g.57149 Transcript_15058/m.57149 type:complete len:217 (+) Transcript_15058:2340-2990(+)